jgi:hypothetical protein
MDFFSRFEFDRGKAVTELGSERAYPDSRGVPIITCFSQPILMLSPYRDHLMLEGFGASLIDASVVQSGDSQREELQQRRSLWTEARASCDIHGSFFHLSFWKIGLCI